MNPQKIWLSPPHMSGQERDYVEEAFRTNWIAPLGPNVDGFESDLENFLQHTHIAALSSGTAALHLGLILLGVQPGDVVICQSFTFSASANPVRYLGGIPVFVDSEPETWNMCPDALEAAIRACLDGTAGAGITRGTRPKAIIPVHLYGMPAQMEAIAAIASKYEIPILEDAAEALGSSINGNRCGTFGDIAALSFNGNKIITTSGGGALVAKTASLAEKARYLSTQARDVAPHYEHSEIGYNYRMSNVLAGIGRGQLAVLPERVAQRRANFAFYRARLHHLPGIVFPDEAEGYFSNRWLTTFTVDEDASGGVTREKIRRSLEAQHIESRPLWKPMHRQPVFAEFPYFGGDVADQLFRDGLCLPSGSALTDDERWRIAGIVAEQWS